MSENEQKLEPQNDSQPPDVIGAVLALADREQEIENLRRMLIFSVGISAGLMLALHLTLRRGM